MIQSRAVDGNGRELYSWHVAARSPKVLLTIEMALAWAETLPRDPSDQIVLSWVKKDGTVVEYRNVEEVNVDPGYLHRLEGTRGKSQA